MKLFTKVTPIEETVSSKGYLWEYDLLTAGYNKLTDEKKFGKIIKVYDNKHIVDIYWPHIKLKTEGVFKAEIKERK